MGTSDKPQTSPVARNRGPGPGAYELPTTVGYEHHDPTKTRAPRYTFRLKPPIVDRRMDPAPNQYTFEKYYTRFGKDGTPKYTARWPLEALSFTKTPAPNSYRAEDVPVMKTNRPPKYSLNDRHKERGLLHSPAPNAYTLPPVIGNKLVYKPSGPSYPMGTYPSYFLYRSSPGPATYSIGSTEVTRPSVPAYTMGNLAYPPTSAAFGPGPGAYLPTPVRCCQANDFGISFGIKHSPYLSPLILPCDNC